MNAVIERHVTKTTFLLTATLLISIAPTFVLWFFSQMFDFPSKDIFIGQLPSISWFLLQILSCPSLGIAALGTQYLRCLKCENPLKIIVDVINCHMILTPCSLTALEQSQTRANQTRSWKSEKQETSHTQRPNTAPLYSNSHIKTQDENSFLKPTSWFSGASRIRAATIEDIGMQVDLATFSKKEQDLQRKDKRYAKKVISLPATNSSKTQCLHGTFKFRKPLKIRPHLMNSPKIPATPSNMITREESETLWKQLCSIWNKKRPMRRDLRQLQRP